MHQRMYPPPTCSLELMQRQQMSSKCRGRDSIASAASSDMDGLLADNGSTNGSNTIPHKQKQLKGILKGGSTNLNSKSTTRS